MKRYLVCLLGLVVVALAGCYVKRYGYIVAADDNLTVTEQWEQRTLFKPEGWPSGIVGDEALSK